jgi:AcrR family transcriptional regulator
VGQRPFHHGNLRADLLDRAEAVLRERGAETLSLRELAREAGVSHGAPRSHFADRSALFDALAARGFDQLADAIDTAVLLQVPQTPMGFGLLRAAAGASLAFAIQNPALLALMASAKAGDPSGEVYDAAARLFSAMTGVVSKAIGPRADEQPDLYRLTLLLSATVQGVSSLVTSGRVSTAQGEILLDDAIRVFLAGAGKQQP